MESVISINKIKKLLQCSYSQENTWQCYLNMRSKEFSIFPRIWRLLFFWVGGGGEISGFKNGGNPHLYSAVTLSIYLFINLLEALFEVLFRYFKAGPAQCTVFIFIQSTLDTRIFTSV